MSATLSRQINGSDIASALGYSPISTALQGVPGGLAMLDGLGNASAQRVVRSGGAVAMSLAARAVMHAVPVEEFGTIDPTGVADSTAALQAAAASGVAVHLQPGASYRIRSMADFASGTAFVSDPANPATLLASAADFSTTVISDGAQGCILHALGKTAPRVQGVRLVYTPARNNVIVGIWFRNCVRPIIEQCDMTGLNGGYFVALDSCTDGSVSRNNIHDGLLDRDSNGQLTGIVVDDNRIGGVGSTGLLIERNTIRNMLCTPAFFAAYDYQTDGMTIEFGGSGHLVAHNRISFTGEAIDFWAANSVISDNVLSDSKAYAIKLIHGASGNLIIGNHAIRSGIAGITVQGGDTSTSAVAGNVVVDNKIDGVNLDGVRVAAQCAAYVLDDTSVLYTATANDNVITGGSIRNLGTGVVPCRQNFNGTGNRVDLNIPAGSVPQFAVADTRTVYRYFDGTTAFGNVGRHVGPANGTIRYMDEDAFGRATRRYDDNALDVMETWINYGISAAGQGLTKDTYFGTGSTTAGVLAVREIVESTDTFAGGSSTRSTRLRWQTVLAGVLADAIIVDPKVGITLLGQQTHFTDGALKLRSYTFAGLPAALGRSGGVVQVSDRAGKPAYSDGTNWRFFSSDAVVS